MLARSPASYGMELQLLGPIEARVGDRTVVLGARKQRALLAMLGLAANRTVSADRLAEGLWGEEPPPSALKMVQLYVSQLRRLLDSNGATIVTHGRGYELQLPADAVDVARFARLVDESRPREALALWRGDALADVADEPFAAAAIRRLDELRVHAHELAIEADLAAGRHAEVIGELEGLVAEHPLRERLHAQRMLALYRSERQSEALDAYRQARGALVEQIGVEPGAELQRLQEAVLAHDASLDAPAPAPPGPSQPAPGRTRRHRRMTALVAVAMLSAAAGLLAFGISRVTAPDRLPRIDENFVGAIDPDGGRIADQYRVGRNPAAVVAGGGSVWVASALEGTVSRIDRERGEIVPIDVGGEPTALAFGVGSLWVANGESREVAQVDPGSNRVVHRLGVGNVSRGVAAVFGELWVTSAFDSVVRRIDLGRRTETRRTRLGTRPTAIAAGAGAVWVASEEAGTVTRLDPRTGHIVQLINVGNGPRALAVGAGAVWVVNRLDGTVSRIDPRTNTVTWLHSVGTDPSAIAAGDEGVWVAGGSAGTVTRIDPEAPQVAERIDVGSAASAIAIADGSVWTAAVAPPASHRGGTLRVLTSFVKGDPVPIDWLDPLAYDFESIPLLSLAYDGLVGYRRTAGAAGATVVGALATDAPRPSEDGRTYLFALHRGLRYSDGTAVRPEDFRASMERFLRVSRGAFGNYYGGIVGADRCMRRPARCDLSAGIATDASAGTIAIHLTRPDEEFLHKLTLPFAYVVPADTPPRPTGERVLPGTGPYRFASWDDERGGQLVRNPYFRSSAGARPAGYADRIEVGLRKQADIEQEVAEVRHGTADVVTIVNAFKPLLPSARLEAIEIRSPGQVHSYPEAVLNYMFLNVRTPPFDDVRVRRAINYATDRARILELEGGSGIASVTCQILPSSFPGYDPRCPYTVRPGPGRPWSAPDIEHARALIAASGTRGERIVVTVPDFKRDIGRYFKRLLDRLGYRASLRVLGESYFGTVYEQGSRVQMGFNGWSMDYASPSTFIEPTFGCVGFLSHLCDRRLMREAERARAALGAESSERWAAIDRHVTDLAPAVPLTNRRSMDLVSKRVGNVQHHMQMGTLLDQLWVH
jgi:ABC-type transport system substrate-binding protein/DNA-binding SARP family transcriptional activator/DNA-binding beta-propeller fold protein YncE